MMLQHATISIPLFRTHNLSFLNFQTKIIGKIRILNYRRKGTPIFGCTQFRFNPKIASNGCKWFHLGFIEEEKIFFIFWMFLSQMHWIHPIVGRQSIRGTLFVRKCTRKMYRKSRKYELISLKIGQPISLAIRLTLAPTEHILIKCSIFFPSPSFCVLVHVDGRPIFNKTLFLT